MQLDNKEFSFRLKAIREEKKYTQEHMAQLLNVSRDSVLHYEKGTSLPPLDVLVGYCTIASENLEYLVFGKKAPDNFRLNHYVSRLTEESRKTLSAFLESIITTLP
ncbi:MAG: helix-turn-helix transcriptional regulator [bacterium]|nr:helix-turn-helix transcriptional regulator [bacterium]MCM1375351.1 helix-turn-helix transcriptional regulator [Muribaculum sp.]